MTTTGPYARGVEVYLKQGWPSVLPVDGKGETPTGMTGYKRPIAPPRDRYVYWAESRAADNITLALPPGVVGLDVDAYKGLGDEGKRWLESLPDTYRSSSRFGDEYDGWSGIRPYKLPAEYHRLAEHKGWHAKVHDCIDVIRFAHRQVVCWPSIHPSKKTVYRWMDPAGELLPEGVVPAVADLPELPVEAVKMLLKPERETQPKADRTAPEAAETGTWDKVTGEWCQAVQKALDDAVTALNAGESRHDTFVQKLTMRLVRLAEQGHRVEDALEAAESLFLAAAGDDRQDDWQRGVDSAEAEVDAAPTADKDKGCCGSRRPADSGRVTGEPPGTSDSELAEWVADNVLVHNYRFVGEWKCWRKWDGKRWAEVDEVNTVERVRQYLLDLSNIYEARAAALLESDDDDEVEQGEILMKVVKTLRARYKVRNVTELARGIASVYTNLEQWDEDPELLNCQNGVVNLRSKDLMPHDSSRLISNITATSYVADAEHDDWKAALKAFANPAVAEYVQRWLGSGLIGRAPSEDHMLLLHGGGSNGKSTIVGPCAQWLGDYARGQLPSSLLGGRDDPRPHEVMELKGLRLGIFEETPDGHHLNAAMVKKMVGSPKATGSLKYKPQDTFDVIATLLLSTNFRPIIADTDDGIWRRMRLVPFPHYFAGPTADQTLRQRLLEGKRGRAEAVLRWLVDGAHDYLGWKDDGEPIPEPATVTDATREWRVASDLLWGFIESNCEVDLEAFTPTADLLSFFNSWAVTRDHASVKWTSRMFAERLSAHGELKRMGITQKVSRVDGKQVRGYAGIKLSVTPDRVFMGYRP